MRAIDLFSGTGSFTKVARELGYRVTSYDNAPDSFGHGGHFRLSVMDVTPNTEPKVSVLWASPPCTGFSIAAIGKSWDKKTGLPKSESARVGMMLMKRTIEIIALTQPDKWYIENPRGMMRKKIEPFLKAAGLNWVRHTVAYCQYGDTRQKPTDIWTNDLDWKPRPMCKPNRKGEPLRTCHVAAPRGSSAGTQGVKSARDRSIVPRELILEILK